MPRGLDPGDEARLQGRLWTPDLLGASLRLWMDARSIGDFTLDAGSRVVAAAEQSRNFSLLGDQATPTNRPLLSQSAAHGWRVFWSVSVAQFLYFAAGDIPYNGAAGLTLVMLGDISTDRAFSTWCSRNSTSGVCEVRWISGGKVQGLRGGEVMLLQSTATAVGTGPHIGSARFATNFCEVGINGARNSSATNPGFTAGINMVGARSTGGDTPYTGGMHSLAIFDRLLSVAELQRVEGALAWRYGRQDALIAGHPHRNSPPLTGA